MSERKRQSAELRMQAALSCLLVIDVQQKLIPAIPGGDQVLESVAWLIKLSREMDVPVRVTEQYPRGLGPTVPEIRSLVLDDELLEKVHFSCMDADTIRRQMAAMGRRQVIMAGTEAHVCVLQSVFQLLEEGYQVFIVDEAVASRKPRDAELALERMRAAGAQIVSREMVAFEWLNCAGTELFRTVSKNYIR
ncbi:hydrolase [Methylonatrum kenyense]|uniref:hydrolase n=1 Tax=Methylonatrum kenyense TaxID=455253 RepID=UPI0031F509C3